MTSEEIDALITEAEAHDAKATAGPWALADEHGLCVVERHHYLVADMATPEFHGKDADAAFIAAARRLVPEMAKALREMREQVTDLEDAAMHAFENAAKLVLAEQSLREARRERDMAIERADVAHERMLEGERGCQSTKLAAALRLQLSTHDQGHSPCHCAAAREALGEKP